MVQGARSSQTMAEKQEQVPVLTEVDDLGAAMRLHDPIYDGMELLLPAGKVLNSADVDFLRRRCPHAQIRIEDPVLHSLRDAIDDGDQRTIVRETRNRLISSISDVQDSFASRLLLRSVDCRGIETAVRGVLEYMGQNAMMATALIPRPGKDHDYLIPHAARVCYVSLVLGNVVRVRTAEAYQKGDWRRSLGRASRIDLTPLALGALFMDLGMWPIQDAFDQTNPLTPEQVQMVRNHAIVSARALPPATDETVKLIVETHHENYDGSGYPYGLHADEIHIFARVLRIADAYAAATSKRLYREALSPARALWEMTCGPYVPLFDPVLLKIFASVMQPYPIGSRVQLQDGRWAAVVRYGRMSSFLPEIVMTHDEHGRELARSGLDGPIKLHERTDLTISSFDGEDVSDLYERDTILPSPSTSEFTTLFEGMYTGFATATSLSQGCLPGD